MPRYFITSNASRPYVAGGFTFEFEPVVIRGGSWLGVLVVAEDAAASALAGAGIAQVEECTIDQYEGVKKKLTAGPSNFPNFQTRPSEQDRAPVVAVEVAERPIGLPSVRADAEAGVAPVSLLARNLNPPDEPLLVESKRKGPRL